MKNKNTFLLIAGILNFFTAILHLIGGQTTLINPLIESDLINQVKFEILGAWHMVTIVLFYTSYLLIKSGLSHAYRKNKEILSFIAFLYIFFAVPSFILSIIKGQLIPQWSLLFPIGVLILIGLKKKTS